MFSLCSKALYSSFFKNMNDIFIAFQQPTIFLVVRLKKYTSGEPGHGIFDSAGPIWTICEALVVRSGTGGQALQLLKSRKNMKTCAKQNKRNTNIECHKKLKHEIT